MGSALHRHLHAWLAGNPDESILRWIFRAVLVVSIAVLAADLVEINHTGLGSDAASPQLDIQPEQPETPSVLAPLLKRLMALPTGDPALEQPLSLELRGGGRLYATGTITPGSARAFTE